MGLVQQYPALNRPSAPICSVCIANYNGAAILDECIASVLAQRLDGEVEIIVHDDASTDGSVSLLRERHPQVELLASQENVGFCISNNRMVAHARGEYVLLLNNDAALAPDAIRCLLSEVSRSSAKAILTLPQLDWKSDALVDRGCLLDPFFNPIPNLDPNRDDVAYVIGACLWCPRSTWNELGGFPSWMESIGEDLYLCGAARLRGIPVRALHDSYYRHRQGATFGGNRSDAGLHTSVRRRRLSERNKTRALMVLTPTFLVWPLLATHLVALLFEGMLLSLLKRDATVWTNIYWPALTTPFCEFRLLRTRRKVVQCTRCTSISKWFSVVHWRLRKVTMLMRYGVPKIE